MFICPFVPDRHPLVPQKRHIGLASQEPQQLIDDRLQMQLLRRQERKAIGQIKPHLVAENAPGAGARPIGLIDASLENMPHQIEIRLHDRCCKPTNRKAGVGTSMQPQTGTGFTPANSRTILGTKITQQIGLSGAYRPWLIRSILTAKHW